MKLQILVAALAVFPAGADTKEPSGKSEGKFDLKSECVVKNSGEAIRIAKGEFKIVAGRWINSNELIMGFGRVVLPFDIPGFSVKNDVFFRYVFLKPAGNDSSATCWVNSSNGKCFYYDAPWLLKNPDTRPSVNAIDVEKKAKYVVKSPNDACDAARKEFEKLKRTEDATHEEIFCRGLVALPWSCGIAVRSVRFQ